MLFDKGETVAILKIAHHPFKIFNNQENLLNNIIGPVSGSHLVSILRIPYPKLGTFLVQKASCH